MPQPLTDPVALQLLGAFKRQPYRPEHLGMLRDRLFDLERQDLLGSLAVFTETWQNGVVDLKKRGRRKYQRFLQTFREVLSRHIPEAKYSSVLAVQGTGQPG